MSIKIQIKSVYGNDLLYPHPSCEVANKLASLIGAKTFSRGHIEILKSLGYRMEVVTPISQLLNA